MIFFISSAQHKQTNWFLYETTTLDATYFQHPKIPMKECFQNIFFYLSPKKESHTGLGMTWGSVNSFSCLKTWKHLNVWSTSQERIVFSSGSFISVEMEDQIRCTAAALIPTVNAFCCIYCICMVVMHTENIYTVYLILHKWCAILNTFRVVMSDPVWPIKNPITILLGATSGKEITHFTFQKQYQCWLERDGLWEITSEVCVSLHPPSVPIKSFNGRHSHHCWGWKTESVFRVALEKVLAEPIYEGVPIWIQHWGFCQVFVTTTAHLLKAASQICKAASF